MKWFKHFSDMHQGRSINNLMDELGHTGLCFFLLQEMCAEKLDESGANLEESATTFHFHQRVVRQNLRISPVNLRRLLDVCAANGLLTSEFSGNTLEIKMPILLELLSRDSKTARSMRATAAKKPRLERDKERDKEEDKEKEVGADVNDPQLPVVTSSTRSSKAQPRGCINEFVYDHACYELLENVTHKAQKSWLAAYPSVDFIVQEVNRANAWIQTNPKKAPKDFGKFMLSWLSRAFETYRKGIPSVHKTYAQKINDSNEEILKKYEAEARKEAHEQSANQSDSWE